MVLAVNCCIYKHYANYVSKFCWFVDILYSKSKKCAVQKLFDDGDDDGDDVVVDDNYDDDELNYDSFVRLIELTFSQSSRRYKKRNFFLVLGSFQLVTK